MWLIALFIAFIETIFIASAALYLMIKAGSGSGLIFLFTPIIMLIETIRIRAVIAFGNTDNRAWVKTIIMIASGGMSFILILVIFDGSWVRSIGFYNCLSFGAISGGLSAACTVLTEKKNQIKST